MPRSANHPTATRNRKNRNHRSVEVLEERIAPAMLVTLTGGTAVSVTGDNANDALTIDVAAGNNLRHNTFVPTNGTFNSDIDWDPTTVGDQTVSVTAGWSLTVSAGGGDDGISFGTAASQAFQLGTLGTITVHGDTHTTGDALQIDNGSDATGRSIGVSATQITIGGGPTISYDTSESVNVVAGSGNDTFNLTGSATGVSYTLNGGNGTDIVSVTADGNHSLTSNVLTVTATGFGSAFTVNEIDTANLTGGTSANTFTVNGWTGTANLDGAANTDIFNVTFNGTAGTVNITGGTESDTVNVTGTSNADAISVSATAIGNGSQTINYGTVETISIDALSGNDTFTLTGSATGVAYTLTGGAHATADAVTVSADGNYSLTGTTLTVTATGFNSPFTLNTIETANLTGGTSANTFSVNGWTGTANLDGGAGDDIFNLTFNGTAGTINVTGGANTAGDTLNIIGTAGADAIGVSATAITRGTETFNYGTVETISIDALSGDDTFTLTGSAAGVT
jgi:hypothetical protein